ncbi:MAG: hypothetical protein PHE59_05160 [Patescibacteria group bacterium]|nr:hypothetical protein [Patescibacteria group bacterium]
MKFQHQFLFYSINNAKNGNFRQKSAVCEIKIHLEITGQDLGIKSENYFSFGITDSGAMPSRLL